MTSFETDKDVLEFAERVALQIEKLKSQASGSAPLTGHLVVVPASLVESIIAALDDITQLKIYFDQQILYSATTSVAVPKVGCGPSCCEHFRSLASGASCAVKGCTAKKKRF